MVSHGGMCYNGANHIPSGPALLLAAGAVSHRSKPVTSPIVPIPDSADNLKRCIKCGDEKPRTDFHVQRSKPDGLQQWCKACKRQYRADNREAHLARDRKYYIEHREERLKSDLLYRSDHREENKERARRYRAEHRDELNERQRQKRAANPEVYRARARRYAAEHSTEAVQRVRQWRKANPDKERARQRIGNHKRRIRKVNAGGTFTSADLEAIRKSQTDKKGRLICWRCNKPITGTPHLDHWIPLDKGGANDAGNLHYMHEQCNLSKGRKHPTEIGRLL